MKETEGTGALASEQRAERDRSLERAHGRYETIPLYADEFIKLSQVRSGKNPVLEELKDSIEKVGLLNSIDVARVDGELMREYIEFTNMVWGSERSFDDVANLEVDGYFYPLVAGHSRHQAIEELEAEGRIETLPIQTKVHSVGSIEDILDLQLGENLHSVPSMERRALAAVEHFTFGVMKGKWKDQDEYFAQHPGRENDKSLLSDGLAIAQLPPEVQNFIFKKKVSLATGIELAKTGKVVRRHIEFLKGERFADMDDETRQKAEQLYLERMVVQSSRIAEGRLNASAAKKVLMASRQRMMNEMFPDKNIAGAPKPEMDVVEFDDSSTLFDILEPAEDTFNVELKRSKAEIAALLQRYSNSPQEFAFEFIELVSPVAGQDIKEQVLDQYEKSIRIGAKVLGAGVLKTSGVSRPQEQLFDVA